LGGSFCFSGFFCLVERVRHHPRGRMERVCVTRRSVTLPCGHLIHHHHIPRTLHCPHPPTSYLARAPYPPLTYLTPPFRRTLPVDLLLPSSPRFSPPLHTFFLHHFPSQTLLSPFPSLPQGDATDGRVFPSTFLRPAELCLPSTPLTTNPTLPSRIRRYSPFDPGFPQSGLIAQFPCFLIYLRILDFPLSVFRPPHHFAHKPCRQ